MLTGFGRRQLPRDSLIDVATSAMFLALGLLFIWIAMAVWLNVPMIIVSAAAVITFQAAVVRPYVRSAVTRRYANGGLNRIVVQHVTREQHRVNRAKLKVGVTSVCITAVVTVIATYIAIVLVGSS